MEIIILLVVLGLLALIIMGMYNSLVKLRVATQEGFSSIDVQLKRRNDLIPNLVETVKGYASHERETLQEVIEARSASVSANGVAENAAADNMLTQALGKLFALSEAYPDLKANQNFLQLQSELSATEDKIAAARRMYNRTVKEYNTKIQSVPQNVIAGMFSFEKAEFYEVEDPAMRSAPQVSF